MLALDMDINNNRYFKNYFKNITHICMRDYLKTLRLKMVTYGKHFRNASLDNHLKSMIESR